MKKTYKNKEYESDVHTEHCCLIHGCKYCDDNCSVMTANKPQSYLCEDCSMGGEDHNKLREQIDVIYNRMIKRKTPVQQTIFIEDWNEENKNKFVCSHVAYDIKSRFTKANIALPKELVEFVEKNDTEFFRHFIIMIEDQIHVLTNDELSFWESVKEIQTPEFQDALKFERGVRHNEELIYNGIVGMDI